MNFLPNFFLSKHCLGPLLLAREEKTRCEDARARGHLQSWPRRSPSRVLFAPCVHALYALGGTRSGAIDLAGWAIAHGQPQQETELGRTRPCPKRQILYGNKSIWFDLFNDSATSLLCSLSCKARFLVLSDFWNRLNCLFEWFWVWKRVSLTYVVDVHTQRAGRKTFAPTWRVVHVLVGTKNQQ
jgi:hypothetical protein